MKRKNVLLIWKLTTFLLVILLFFSFFFIKNENIEKNRYSKLQELNLTSCSQFLDKDISELCLRIRNKNKEEFNKIYLSSLFHGNLDPYVVYGVKMGLYAKELLKFKEGKLIVYSETRSEPPLGYLNDGIMVSTGSTIGRDLFYIVSSSDTPSAIFYYQGKSVRLKVRPEKIDFLKEKLDETYKKFGDTSEEYKNKAKEVSLYVLENFSNQDLFEVIFPNKEGYYCHYNQHTFEHYLGRLRTIFKKNPSEEEVLDFIDKDECVEKGSVSLKNPYREVKAIWKSNNESVVYYFNIKENHKN